MIKKTDKMSKLFDEAIADAKAVRDTAMTNAKIALEEAFAPKLQAMFSEKIRQEAEEAEEKEDVEEEPVTEGEDEDIDLDIEEPVTEGEDEDIDLDIEEPVTEGEDEDIDLDIEEPVTEGEDEDIDLDIEEPVTEGEDEDIDLDIEEPVTEGEDEEDIDLDLDENEDIDLDIEEPVTEGEDDVDIEIEDDEDIDLDIEEPVTDGEDDVDIEIEDDTEEDEEPKEKDLEESKRQVRALTKKLHEAVTVISKLRHSLNETNLLNSRLSYATKIFTQFNSLNDKQKLSIIDKFDEADTVKEVKLVYSTLIESFKNRTKLSGQAKRLTEGIASKTTGTTAPSRKVLTESTDAIVKRFQKLANL